MSRRNSRVWAVVVALFAWPVTTWAQDDVISRRIQADDVNQVTVVNVAGRITVTGVEGRDVVVEATKRGDADARDEVEVEITERGNRIEIRTRYPRNSRGRVSVEFDIQVPRDLEVSAKSVSGDIVLDGINGVVRGETVSGDVEATSLAELRRAQSVSGDVVLTGASSGDAMEVKSVSGRIQATAARARRIEFSTVSGDITLENVESSDTTLRSTSGRLEYSGTLAPDGRYDLQSHSGEIRLRVPTPSGFDVEASSYSGTIESEFAITTQGAGGRGRRTLTGRFGDGGARLDLTTFSGDISIERQ